MPKPGPRTMNKYSDRFKATAVRLSELPGVAVQDVAASLYIHPFMLSRWRKQMREGRIVTQECAGGAGSCCGAEVAARDEEEYERLKLEHDILKKAIAFTSERRARSSSSSKPIVKRSRSE